MTMLLLAGMLLPAGAQKFALVDMEYILKNIPAYERANEQLSQTSKKWQAEVEALNQQAQTLYKNYQNELVFLSAEQKKQREEAILAKEKEASDLKKKYFSPEGELYKKRESLRLCPHPRPRQRQRHRFRLTDGRYFQRSPCKIRLFQLKHLTLQP